MREEKQENFSAHLSFFSLIAFQYVLCRKIFSCTNTSPDFYSSFFSPVNEAKKLPLIFQIVDGLTLPTPLTAPPFIGQTMQTDLFITQMLQAQLRQDFIIHPTVFALLNMAAPTSMHPFIFPKTNLP